jgi:hypothetical protein
MERIWEDNIKRVFMNVGYEAVKWLWSTGERFFDVDDEI